LVPILDLYRCAESERDQWRSLDVQRCARHLNINNFLVLTGSCSHTAGSAEPAHFSTLELAPLMMTPVLMIASNVVTQWKVAM
ncbi:hypothetical protein CYMTET_24776, partial [Cymbomonas tetramitiformis]